MSELIIPAGQKKQIMIVHDKAETSQQVIRLAGEGAEVQVDEVFMAGAQSNVVIVHDALRTVSRVNTRGIVGKGKHVLSHAKVIIPKHAQLSDSFVSQHFLLLDESAQAEALPSLEIEADEVKASHAATISPLDEEKLFYLTSRGLSTVEARRLIIEGFLKLPKEYGHLVDKWQA